MKKIILLAVLFIDVSISNAQSYAVIKDKDDFVNIRNDKSNQANIIGKLFNDDIFAYDPDEQSEWVEIYRMNGRGIETNGYIHKSKIFPLSKFKSVKHLKIFRDSCIATNDTLEVTIKSVQFNIKKHKPGYIHPHILEKIDGKSFWGTDGEIPRKSINTVKVSIKGIAVEIPENSYNDLYEPNFRTLKVYLTEHNTIYVEMDNSDGAGGYTVVWIIKDGKFLKRYVDNID